MYAAVEEAFCVREGRGDAPAVTDGLVDVEEVVYVLIGVNPVETKCDFILVAPGEVFEAVVVGSQERDGMGKTWVVQGVVGEDAEFELSQKQIRCYEC
jgi:hypothetical protein